MQFAFSTNLDFNNMKKFIAIILLGFLITSVYSQSDNTIKWESGTIRIDGNTSDWAAHLPLYDNKTKLVFDIRNDSNNLYLAFQLPDQSSQFKVARAGMNINFAVKTKPKRNAAIVFSPFMYDKSGDRSGGYTRNTNVEKKGQNPVRQRYMVSPAIVQASGFVTSNGNLSSDNNSTGIIYAVGWDTLNTMTMEFKVPLKELFGDHYDLKTISQNDISMTVKENAVESPKSEGGSGHGGGEGGGMGHGGGGGMGGGMGHGGGGMGHGGGGRSGGGDNQYGSGGTQDRSSMFEAQTLKQKFRLNCKTK